jgi:hypothetical protein
MIFQKTSSFIIAILLITSFHCLKKHPDQILFPKISPSLDSLFGIYGDNLAFLSCLRCGCFVDSYNKNFVQRNEKPTNYILLTDTTCNRLRFAINYISTNEIEKISDEFYNVTFVKKRDTKIWYKILKVEESDKMRMTAKNFFGE